MASGEDQEAGAYLTRADMPELVKSVAEALMVQLRKVTPAPEEAGPMPELVKSVAEALMVQLRKVTPAPEEAGPSHSTRAG